MSNGAPLPNDFPKMPSQMFAFEDPVAGQIERLCPLRWVAGQPNAGALIVFATAAEEGAFNPQMGEVIPHHTEQDTSHTQSDWSLYGGMLRMPALIGDNWKKVSTRVRQLLNWE